MGKLFLLGAIVLFFGCSHESERIDSQIIKTKANQVSRFENNISIEVKNVNDSRCPQGCQCFWAGEVSVSVKISQEENSLDTCLVLPSQPKIEFMNAIIELKDVSPYPICDNQFPSDYIFTFVVSVLESN